MNDIHRKHVITRTSPKGEMFYGRCILCGEESLKPQDAAKECENLTSRTTQDVLREVIK